MASKKSPEKKDTFTRNLVIAIVIAAVAVMVLPKLISQRSNSAAAIPAQVSKADGYGMVFNPTATPTVDIWEDFQCPVCQQFEALNGAYIDSLISEKKAKVVFHVLSFIGNESVIAANAAACAADENKFLAFHNSLYANQPKAENTGTWTNDYMINLGASVGVKSSKFEQCVRKGSYAEYVTNVAKDGATKNVNSTPTVFVNGKEIDRNTAYFNADAFKKAIESAK